MHITFYFYYSIRYENKLVMFYPWLTDKTWPFNVCTGHYLATNGEVGAGFEPELRTYYTLSHNPPFNSNSFSIFKFFLISEAISVPLYFIPFWNLCYFLNFQNSLLFQYNRIHQKSYEINLKVNSLCFGQKLEVLPHPCTLVGCLVWWKGVKV